MCCKTKPSLVLELQGSIATVFQIIAVAGVNIKPYSALKAEDEVVLPPGSRFVIDKITPCKDGVTEVRMRELLEDSYIGGGSSTGDGSSGTSSAIYEELPYGDRLFNSEILTMRRRTVAFGRITRTSDH